MSIQDNLKKAGPEFLLNLKKQNGEVFWIQDYLFAFNENYVNEIYVKQYNNFTKAGGWHKIKEGIGSGLLTSEEPNHLVNRRILNPAFHVNKINKHIDEMRSIISQELSNLQSQSEFNISDYFLNLSYVVLTNTLFNDKTLSESKEFKDIFYSIMKKTVDDEDPHHESLEEYRNSLYNLISKVVLDRVSNEEHNDDFLDLLIESFNDGEMSLHEIVDEILSMLLAGHETTANVVSWAICHVALNQEIKNNIKIESDLFIDKINTDGVLDSLKDLNNSEYVIKETLRLYPPVWSSPREAISDCYIEDTFIPKGTKIILSSYVSHRDEKYFDDPELFMPDRWDNNFEDTLPQGSYFPFHLGPRKCIGYRFGEIQAKITLLEFFKNFEIDLLNGMPKGVPYATYRISENFCVELRKNDK
jgi:cytochrome P450